MTKIAFLDFKFLFTKRKKGKYLYLMLALFAMIVAYPFLRNQDSFGSFIIALVSTIVPLAALYGFGSDRHHFALGILLGTPFVVMIWVDAVVKDPIIQYLHVVLAAIFYVYTGFILLQQIIKSEEVTADTLYGAISVYLLIGVMWAFFYLFINLASPGSFSGGSQPVDMFYYSFVTLTTLGYGDIIPVSPPAQAFAIFEAVCGAMYVAILISHIVGVHIVSAQKDEQKKNKIDLI